MTTRYKWRRIALFHIGLIISIAATSLLAPEIFFILALGFIFYLTLLFMFWICRFITFWAWGERKNSSHINPIPALCLAAIFAIAALITSFKAKGFGFISGLIGMAYFFLYQALPEENAHENQKRRAQ